MCVGEVALLSTNMCFLVTHELVSILISHLASIDGEIARHPPLCCSWAVNIDPFSLQSHASEAD